MKAIKDDRYEEFPDYSDDDEYTLYGDDEEEYYNPEGVYLEADSDQEFVGRDREDLTDRCEDIFESIDNIRQRYELRPVDRRILDILEEIVELL